MPGAVLIANRGEIACRIIGTAREMGIRTIAVYSQADQDALHTELADEAVHIGPANAAESYLRPDKILEAARSSGADSIHPGYGFLSENPDFAAACRRAKFTFIGPPTEAIRTMADKGHARQAAIEAGIPVLGGYHGDEQSRQRLVAEAASIGYPVIIKPVAGGGGKGIRIASDPDELAELIEPSRREALMAFADDRLLLERYLDRPRHIEVQIFADSHGNNVHLFDRDCSLQRRHQKVIEEAPARCLSNHLRDELTDAALKLSEAIGYVGAGTVEFLVEGPEFFFMEMNTRLQVEHPVTEMITGIDLVEWQFRIAAGESLPRKQAQISSVGHAIEARIYAEDTENQFLPDAGTLALLKFPEPGPDIRIDSGVRKGDRIGINYDPMIAKLSVRGSDSTACWERLGQVLKVSSIAGVKTNLPLLSRLTRHPDVRDGTADTRLIERCLADLSEVEDAAPPMVLAIACFCLWQNTRAKNRNDAAAGFRQHSSWFESDGWRMNLPAVLILRFELNNQLTEVTCSPDGKALETEVDGVQYRISGRPDSDHQLRVSVNGHHFTVVAVWSGTKLHMGINGRFHTVNSATSKQRQHTEAHSGTLTASMTGRVIKVLAAPDDEVKQKTTLLVIEAMKMEHDLNAPVSGRIESLDVQVDQLVEQGQNLGQIIPAQDTES